MHPGSCATPYRCSMSIFLQTWNDIVDNREREREMYMSYHVYYIIVVSLHYAVYRDACLCEQMFVHVCFLIHATNLHQTTWSSSWKIKVEQANTRHYHVQEICLLFIFLDFAHTTCSGSSLASLEETTVLHVQYFQSILMIVESNNNIIIS